eukprot:COSAG01_NODE_916_length_12760_cov_13.023379_6_plen_62_part_00
MERGAAQVHARAGEQPGQRHGPINAEPNRPVRRIGCAQAQRLESFCPAMRRKVGRWLIMRL